jgi:hypothetical protein
MCHISKKHTLCMLDAAALAKPLAPCCETGCQKTAAQLDF